MRERESGVPVLALGGWLLMVAGLVAPWLTNRETGAEWLVQIGDDEPPVLAGYGLALGCSLVAVALLARRRAPVGRLGAAAAGVLLTVALVLVTPPHTVRVYGATLDGRPFEIWSESVWSAGPYLALAGAALVLAGCLLAGRRVARPGPSRRE